MHCPKALFKLFRNWLNAPWLNLKLQSDENKSLDLRPQIPLMSLPGSLPINSMVLNPEGGYLKSYRDVNKAKGIGLVWAAGLKNEFEAERSRLNRSISTKLIFHWIDYWHWYNIVSFS